MTDATVEPDDPTERIIARLDVLIETVDLGRGAVAAETAAREIAMAEERSRSRRLVALVAAALLVLLAVLGLVGYERITRNETTCAEKLARSDIADQRVLIAVDRLAASDYVDMPADERERLTAGLEAQLDQLPPPC